MKKIIKIASIIALFATTTFGALAGSLAWFTNAVVFGDPNVEGSAVGAYFAYGDGSAEKPYGIRETRHLYNLAWLQYMGFFYDRAGFTAENPPHFELAGNLTYNSSSAIKAIPPIGTSTNPFQGVFDGQGYTMSGYTFTNDIDKFGYYPKRVTSFTPMTDIGVFGVIDGEDTVVKNLGLSQNTVSSSSSSTNVVIGAAVGVADAKMENIAVDTPTISIGNGTSTGTLSDFGLVGRCNETYKKRVQKANGSVYNMNVDYETFVVEDSGEGTPGWGGSIDMASMHARLSDIMNNYIDTYSTDLPNSTTEYYDEDGSVVSSTTNSYLSYSFDSGEGQLRAYNKDKQGDGYNERIGAFQLGAWNQDTSTAASAQNGPNDWLISLSGGHWATRKVYYSHSGRPISDGNGNYLVRTSDTDIVNQNNPSKPTLWNLPSVGGSAGTISTTYNGSTLYLYVNNSGALKLGATQNTWTLTDVGNGKTVFKNNNNYCLFYYGGWKAIQNPSFIKDISKNTYMKPDLESGKHHEVTAANSYSFDTLWGTSGDGKYYEGLNGSEYKLNYYRGGLFSSEQGVQTNSGGTGDYVYDPTTKKFYMSGRSKYIYFSSNKYWSTSTSSSASTFDIIDASTSLSNCVVGEATDENGPDSRNGTSGMCYHDQNVTYFPLNAANADGKDDDKVTSIRKYEARQNNTGYVIGGNNFTSSSSEYNQGTVRVAKYSQTTNITNFNGTSFDDVYTVDSSGTFRAINSTDEKSFQKYAASKRAMESTLADSRAENAVYGLHFQQAPISINNLVTASYAEINGTVHRNYQLPASSIDFNLKQKGFVNFFAGSYMNKNTVDNFFTLHRVTRDSEDETKITAIDEILDVFSDGDESHSYILKMQTSSGVRYSKPYRMTSSGVYYELKDNPEDADIVYTAGDVSESVFNTKYSSNFVSVFNTSRIKSSSAISDNQKLAFYFEIPINAGEYCLGSDSTGTNGGYLLYLDIGANAQKAQRTEVFEKFVLVSDTYTYPDGIALVQNASSALTAIIAVVDNKRVATSSIDSKDSVAILIKATAVGTIALTRTSNTVALSRDGPDASKIDLRYKADSITATDGVSPLNLVSDSQTTRTETRVTYFDTDLSTSTVTKTVISHVDGVTDNTVVQTKNGSSVASPIVFKGLDYSEDKLNGTGHRFSDSELKALPTSGAQATTCFEYSYTIPSTTIVANLDWELLGSLITSGTDENYHTLTSYKFKMTRTGEDYVVTVDKASSTISVSIGGSPKSYTSFKYYINGTEVTVGSTPTINVVTPQQANS